MPRLPRVYQTLLELQMLDITTTPIEVAPTAHYSMGGVWVRPEDHGTGVEGLYAIGEASSGLHGANRLGGNSLIELLVYGRIVGHAAAAYSAAELAAQRRSAGRGRARRGPRSTGCSRATGPRTCARCSARARHDDRARRRRPRRGGLLAGLAELDAIEARMARRRRAPRHRRASRTSPTRST